MTENNAGHQCNIGVSILNPLLPRMLSSKQNKTKTKQTETKNNNNKKQNKTKQEKQQQKNRKHMVTIHKNRLIV